MVVLNFGHPLTSDHVQQLEHLAGTHVERIIDVDSQIDSRQPLAPQVIGLAEACALSAAQWQTLPLLVNLPSLNVIAGALLAELHGRCGYFPTIVRLRPVAGSTPARFEVAELVNLQSVRDGARERRAT